jgi:hypothetical protein
MIHGKSNEVRWRDKGYDYNDCVIERHDVYSAKSKEANPK